MPGYHDGPSSSLFEPLELESATETSTAARANLSPITLEALDRVPRGECTAWGIRFLVREPLILEKAAMSIELASFKAGWLVLMHTSDLRSGEIPVGEFISPMRGQGMLGEHAADYVFCYEDGEEVRVAIKRRHQVGMWQRRWGENCFEAVADRKPLPQRWSQVQRGSEWGEAQTQVSQPDEPLGERTWINWLWAWENPNPGKLLTKIRFEPISGTIFLFALSKGEAFGQPLRWRPRRKACLTLPPGEVFKPELDEKGLLEQVRLDMGQVISAVPRPVYPEVEWSSSYCNQLPDISKMEVLIEYTSHSDASFHLDGGRVISVNTIEERSSKDSLVAIPPAKKRVVLKVVEKVSGKPVPVKLHLHGTMGENLVPVDRHRIPNPEWFQDYSVDFVHAGNHPSTYISGETFLDLPEGKVYIEVSKGFEIKPVRKVVEVKADTPEIAIELDRVLNWREKGWVTADTHVHFLSPVSALLEGSAEGVNVVNLLASQWGELMTNVGDFDGSTTWGSKETGGDGEHLVRVGTENRQHVLGHISLLGYEGRIIAPMTTGGPNESALGDPVEILLTEWARMCKKQGGLVVLPHFPNPRAEHAASIVHGEIDALEMTSWGNLYWGIDPYSLSDWYRYLNCGYLVPAVGGTDKMSAGTAVGTVRTYAKILTDQHFSYSSWMDAVRKGETFVTYGPLLEFSMDGKAMGERTAMSRNGGTVDVTWEVASVTIPMSRIELVVNGEIRESLEVSQWSAAGNWKVAVDRSSWLALLVRGHYQDKPEIITAHSTPVMIDVEDSPMLAAADGVTILEQIEGTLAYLDTVGTRKDEVTYKRMRMVLSSAYRNLHNRMHAAGYYHNHSPVENHEGHD